MHDIAPAIAAFCIFGLPVFAWIIKRGMEHTERMEMIKRGVYPGPRYNAGPPGSAPGRPVAPDDAQRGLRKGVMTAMIGFALFIGLSFIGFEDPARGWYPGPWLIGGLVPMFVGIAQIVNALMSGAEFPRRAAPSGRANPWQAPPPPGPPPSEPARPGGAYTYRPSGENDELPSPAPAPRRPE